MRRVDVNHKRVTLATIGDMISRGRCNDPIDLRRRLQQDRTSLDKVRQVSLRLVGMRSAIISVRVMCERKT